MGNAHFASSIRLEVLSDTNDDYDYLRLAEQLIGTNQTYRNKLDSIISSLIVPNNVDYKGENLPNSAKITEARNKLADLIETLSVYSDQTFDFFVDQESAKIDFNSISNWQNSKLAISFDFMPTSKIEPEPMPSKSKKVATVSLMMITEDSWTCMTDQTDAWFGRDVNSTNIGTVTQRQGGWYNYTVPFSAFKEFNKGDGQKSVNAISFKWLGYQFIVKNFMIVDLIEKHDDFITFDTAVDNWQNSKRAISFDFMPTSKVDPEPMPSNPKKVATVSLMMITEGSWTCMTDQTYSWFGLDGNSTKIGAVTELQDGWYNYTVPLSAFKEYKEGDGKKSVNAISFRWLGYHFIFKNFRIINDTSISIHAQPSKVLIEGDLNEDGCVDKLDVKELQNYLSGKNKNIQTSWQEADLDYNGILNGVDKTLLKRMILTQ